MLSRSVVCLVVLLGVGTSAAQSPKNFELKIGDQIIELNLDEPTEWKDADGRSISLELTKKPITQFRDDYLSFQHKNVFNVTTEDLGDGITQLLMATASGGMVLIQEYPEMNPKSLISLMVDELTKEDVEYGYQLEEENITMRLSSGEKVNGVRATLKYKSEVQWWEVFSIGKKDEGILILTHLDKEFMDTDGKVLDLFWQTLAIHF